jgi:hypothetical protein
MKSAFRTASLLKHPDHNPSPTALREYEEFQEAFEVLEDQDKRRRYELYGDWNKGAELQDGLHSASFYLAWLGVLYYLSYVEEFKGTGKWQHFLLLGVACFELQVKTQQMPLSSKELTLNQQVELVKDLLPTAMLLYYVFHFSTASPNRPSPSYEPEPALREALQKMQGAIFDFGIDFANAKIADLMAFRRQLKAVRKAEKNNIGGVGGRLGWGVKLALTIGAVYALNSLSLF